MSRQCTHYGRWPQHGFTSLKKLRPQSVTSRIQPGSDVIVCAEMDEHWGYVGAKSRQRWLFYAYDRIRRTVVAHVFGERTLATLERLLSLLSAFEVVVWMTDGWPLYESRLKGKLHVISKRYTQRIERHNLNLRQHLRRRASRSRPTMMPFSASSVWSRRVPYVSRVRICATLISGFSRSSLCFLSEGSCCTQL
ncbi:IS1 ORF2 [Shigella flexneri 2a]|nr:IS1 ORF2 [Shigella flexneri 2a]